MTSYHTVQSLQAQFDKMGDLGRGRVNKVTLLSKIVQKMSKSKVITITHFFLPPISVYVRTGSVKVLKMWPYLLQFP